MSTVPMITVAALSQLRQREVVQLIDVRSPSEFAAGHVPGAQNIPLEEVESRAADLGEASPIVLICQSGQRATMASERLRPLKQNLAVLEGGTAAWKQSGAPMVATAASSWALERQVRLIAGLIVLTGALLALLGDARWALLCGFVGAGLTFAGLTNICGMALVLRRMPWNRAGKCLPAQAGGKGCCGM